MAQIKSKLHDRRWRLRSCTGANTAEFGATLAVLICLILIPLCSAVFIPVRYAMCQGVITDFVGRLAHCKTRSDAYKTLGEDEKWKKLLAACGTEVKDVKLVLVATTTKGGQEKVIDQGAPVPDEWLPDGNLGGCAYSLHIDCDCAISPLFGGSGSVPGINAPVTLKVSSSANWTNLSRDPQSPTLAFYLQE